MKHIKNIIFDLGGVLLNIDPSKTNTAFEKLGVKNFKDNYSLHKADALFDNLEMGKVSEEEFYNSIRQTSGIVLTDEQIRDAWNALLLDFRIPSLEWIEKNKKKYHFFLLSNTNHIHHTAFKKHFTIQTGRQNFDHYFTKAYYSHHTGFRKPNKEIFEFALQDAGITAAETIFIDDLFKNIKAAASLGIHTHHLQANEQIEKLGL
jgi:HAD superfamily hydrolase (TIGR01509 family)